MRILLGTLGVLMVIGIIYTQTSWFGARVTEPEHAREVKREQPPSSTRAANDRGKQAEKRVESGVRELPPQQLGLETAQSGSTAPSMSDAQMQEHAKLADQKREEINKLIQAFDENLSDPAARAEIRAKTDKLMAEYNAAVLPVALAKIREERAKADEEAAMEGVRD